MIFHFECHLYPAPYIVRHIIKLTTMIPKWDAAVVIRWRNAFYAYHGLTNGDTSNTVRRSIFRQLHKHTKTSDCGCNSSICVCSLVWQYHPHCALFYILIHTMVHWHNYVISQNINWRCSYIFRWICYIYWRCFADLSCVIELVCFKFAGLTR